MATTEYVMLWKKTINKSLNTRHPKYYPNRKAIATPGFFRGNPVWIVEVAINTHEEGYTCPHCGTNGNHEYSAYVQYENFPAAPYVLTECTCRNCRNSWEVRSRTTSVESVVEYVAPRNPASGLMKF